MKINFRQELHFRWKRSTREWAVRLVKAKEQVVKQCWNLYCAILIACIYSMKQRGLCDFLEWTSDLRTYQGHHFWRPLATPWSGMTFRWKNIPMFWYAERTVFKMICTGVPHIVLHVLCSTRTPGGYFIPPKVSFGKNGDFWVKISQCFGMLKEPFSKWFVQVSRI